MACTFFEGGWPGGGVDVRDARRRSRISSVLCLIGNSVEKAPVALSAGLSFLKRIISAGLQ